MGIDSDRLIGQCLIIVCRVGLAILIDEDGRNQTYPRPEERLGPQLGGGFFFHQHGGREVGARGKFS